MKQCGHCGWQGEPGMSFCGGCGAPFSDQGGHGGTAAHAGGPPMQPLQRGPGFAAPPGPDSSFGMPPPPPAGPSYGMVPPPAPGGAYGTGGSQGPARSSGRPRWLIPAVAAAAIVLAVVVAMVVWRPWAPYNHAESMLSDQSALTQRPQQVWTRAADDLMPGTDDDYVRVVGTSQDESIVVVRLDSGFVGVARDTGEAIWAAETDSYCRVPGGGGADYRSAEESSRRSDVLVCADESSVVYRDIATGAVRERFSAQVAGEIVYFTVANVDGAIIEVATDEDGRLSIVSRNPKNLKENWKHNESVGDVSGAMDFLVAVVGSDVVISTGDRIHAYDKKNGRPSTRLPQSGYVAGLPNGTYLTVDHRGRMRITGEGSLNAQSVQGIVLLDSYDRLPELHLACRDDDCSVVSATTRTGKQLWTAPAMGSAGAFCGNHYIIPVSSSRGDNTRMVAHVAGSGESGWETPSVSYQHGYSCRKDQFLIHNEESVVAYDARSGQRQWTIPGGYSVTHLDKGMLVNEGESLVYYR